MDEVDTLVALLTRPCSPETASAPEAPWGTTLRDALERIARVAAELPHDILGLGALGGAAGHGPAAERAESSLRARLERVADEMTRLRSELVPLREAYLAHQLRAFGITPASRGLQLNLTGERPLAGWLNVGAHPSGIVTNLLWPLPFPDASARRVLFAMAIEHFPLRRVPDILREIHRVLEPGGVLRIITQDTQQYIDAYARRDVAFFEAQRRHWDIPRELGPLLHHVLAWAGTSRAPDDFFDHKYGYDFESLSRLLRRAGFNRVEQSAYMASRHPDLRIDASSADAGARHDEGFYALFVEATRGPEEADGARDPAPDP